MYKRLLGPRSDELLLIIHVEAADELWLDKKLNPYRCPTCKKRFPHLYNMEKHYKERHGHERPVECPKCTCRFFTERKLNEHMSSSHEPDDPLMTIDAKLKPNGASKESGKYGLFGQFVTFRSFGTTARKEGSLSTEGEGNFIFHALRGRGSVFYPKFMRFVH